MRRYGELSALSKKYMVKRTKQISRKPIYPDPILMGSLCSDDHFLFQIISRAQTTEALQNV